MHADMHSRHGLGVATIGLLFVGCGASAPLSTAPQQTTEVVVSSSASAEQQGDSTDAQGSREGALSSETVPLDSAPTGPDELADSESVAKLKARESVTSITSAGEINSGFDDDRVFGVLVDKDGAEMEGGVFVETIPTATFGEPKITGRLKVADITHNITAREAELVACYEKELPAKPTVAVTFSFSINARGTVTKVSAKGVSGGAAKCMVAVIKGTTFPVGKRGMVKVVYPVELGMSLKNGFGFGRSDVGPGGGGTGWGTIGTGRYGAIGHGGGTGSATGRASSGGVVSQVRAGEPMVTGNLDENIIKRYIKRNLSRIRYCYDKELAANATLAGLVTATFEIGPNGLVASSTATGVDGNVSTCVAGVMKGIKFPAPDSGSVTVSYPFTFGPSAP